MKSINELAKSTPAGEYLTSALMDFDPNHFEGFAAIADGANKLLMLVSTAKLTENICIVLTRVLFFYCYKLVLHIYHFIVVLLWSPAIH